MDYQDFKNILLKRKKEIILQVQGNIDNIHNLKGSDPSDEADIWLIDNGSHIEEKINENLRLELQEIIASLEKINNSVYGICEYCEEEIHPARLKIKPHAKYCINCREKLEKGGKL